MFGKTAVHIIIPAVFCVLFTATADARKPGSPVLRDKIVSLASSSASELIVELRPPAPSGVSLDVDGKMMELLTAHLCGSTTETGRPGIPTQGFLAALPPGTEPAVDIIESQFEITNSMDIAPAPSFTFTAEGEAVPEYHIDRTFYETYNQFYPSVTVQRDEVTRMRDLAVVKVIVYPYQYNPATRQLKRYSYLKVRVRFTPNGGKTVQSIQHQAAPDPQFDPLYNNLVVNYRDAASWRTVDARVAASVTTDSTASWFQTGRTYYRIPVINDGIYRLSYAALLGFGIDLATMNNSSAALYYMGRSQPIRVSIDSVIQNSFIEFYAHRNHGIDSYFNRYNDTSAYWLTWNDPSPLRYADAPRAEGQADTSRWYIEHQWNEQDKYYFFGVTQDDLLTTDDVQGEGWYWDDFVTGVSRIFLFPIDSVQRTTGVPVQFRIRLNGMTICNGGGCVVPSQHEATLYINRTVIGVVDFTQNNDTIFTCTFPDSLLRKGNDTLRVTSKTWDATNISKFYMDWFEVDYPRPLLGSSGVLKFTAAPAAPGTHAFAVTGIPADSATIYDLTGGRRISSLTKTGPTTFVFTDTISTQLRDYMIVKQNAKRTPSSLAAKQFADIRHRRGGVDYMLITHALFRSQADRLASYRGAQDGLRTAVIDVQDIYDEFNYGHLDPLALKNFLKYAYYQWRKPSPAYVLFFGDATWDFKKNLSTSVKINYVPSYGNPPSDNALVSFDSTMNFMPDMLAGRLPVSTPQEAQSVVDKVIGYDNPPVSDWNSHYLFLTDGNTPSEKYAFNYYSDEIVNNYVLPPPIGGGVVKVYKTSDAIIDGDYKPYCQQLFASGLVMVNFIGHSGGRVWGVDIGSPYQLQNTNGMLPFVASVSCNVGFFSDPHANVLSEDFVLADNRGAIACWAASSLGYATVGRLLVDKFMDMASHDYARNIGLMTTVSRINFWILNNRYVTPLIKESMNLHPLIGDPYTHLAVPQNPDFAVTPDGISLVNDPPLADSVITIDVKVKNYGLAAGSTIQVAVKDRYTDQNGHTVGPNDIVPPFMIDDFTAADSFAVRWDAHGKPGSHTVTITIDPNDSIPELSKSNNSASKTFYIYRNSIDIIRPLPQSLVTTQTTAFTVTVPSGSDTTALTYRFEIDTAAAFNSPAKISSGPVLPGKVSASWTSPSLNAGRSYYWRAQGISSGTGSTQGAWAGSSFTVTASPLPADTAYWQQTGRLFSSSTLTSATVTDSGATLLRSDSTSLYVRSLGSLANMNTDYYSVLQVNTTVAAGLWWETAYSYLAGWFNPVDGSYLLKGFNFLQNNDAQNMLTFLASVPNGYYVMLSAVQDGRQNMTDTLTKQIKALGSAKIDSLLRGQCWLMVSQKGVRMPIVEMYKAAAAVEATVMVPNFFRLGPAEILTPPIGPALRWGTLSWDVALPNAGTTDTIRVYGMGKNGATSAPLALYSAASGSADLSTVDPSQYPQLRLDAKLACSDGASSPLLRRWSVRYAPPPDLAISAWSFAVPQIVQAGVPTHFLLDVYNAGYSIARSVWAECYLADDTTQRAIALIDTLAPGSMRHVDLLMTVAGANGIHSMVADAVSHASENDLILENNTVAMPFQLAGSAAAGAMKVLFDNVEIRDGDYVSPKPVISIEFPPNASIKGAQMYIASIDGKEIQRNIIVSRPPQSVTSAQNITVNEQISDGAHTLEIRPQNVPQNQDAKKVIFQVASQTALRDPFNYPNPFSGGTVFTFVLTGSHIPSDLQIKIFTVAGRVIRTIHVSAGQLQIGMNRVPWDGRDEQGDEIANGYYFYRITASEDGNGAEVIQRLVKMR